MKIRTKIIFPIMICATILSVFIIGYLYYSAKEIIVNQINNHLEVVAYSKTNRIQYFLEENKEAINQFSNGFIFEELLTVNKSDENYPQKLKAVIKRLKDIEKAGEHIWGVFVMDKNGIIVASSGKNDIGKNKSEDSYFTGGKKAVYIKDSYVSEDKQINVISFSAPIINDDEEFLGVIAMRIAVEKYNEIVSSSFGLGETEEIYLVNKDGYMITSSKFMNDTFLKQKIDSINFKHCLDHQNQSEEKIIQQKHIEHEAIETFDNYRGVAVLGAHNYISEMNWCLLVEMEKKEIMAPVNKLLISISISFIVFFIFFYFILLWISQKITKPIETLHRGTEIIEKGDLNYKVGIKTKDEIGQLSRAFDKMTAAVRRSRREINKKVKEQTGEIRKKQNLLENQQKAILNILEDVEEEKELTAKERDKINAILYSIGDGVFVVDRDLKITMFNQAAADISGFSAKEIIGKKYSNILKFIYEKDRKVNDKFIKDAISNGKIQEMANHTLLIRKDDSEIAVADSAAPLKNKKGNVFGCVVVFRNVTKEREIDRAKTEFVSLASHQLRTPLTAINWYTEMLLSGDAGKLKKEQVEYLKEIYKGNQRMVELVNALLNVSRLELGTFMIDSELVDIIEIAKDACNELSEKIKTKKIRFTKKYSKEIPKIKLDRKMTYMIFQNLLSNAVKYTPKGGRISLEILKEKKELKIIISDSGIGITKSQQDKIFTKLFRADNVRTTDTEGTGLGLYIVKSILDQTGGKILFKSEENKGTTFFVKIPLSGMKKKVDGKKLT